ncbi:pancreas transcription factor 1 subunit alpha-like [Babylonia areolata]|uniref:pancreas transcription factor 1 subunit alpha-like n=1 Tax=Babylonia areolata TaxID=304850 RepID=UPI003FD2F31C
MDTSNYFCSLTDDLFDFGEPGDYYDYCDSGLASPGSSSSGAGSDIENQLVYDTNTNNLLPSSSSSLYHDPTLALHPHHHHNHNHHPYPQGHGAREGKALVVGGKKVFQRKAANMRERRRMKSINDAFETLRTCIPNEVQAERRLSKVDTLRLAMRYIRFLSDLVQSCGGDYCGGGPGGVGGAGVGGPGGRKGQRLQEKIIVRSRLAEDEGVYGAEEGALLGHSLSWEEDPQHRQHHPNSKRVAKIWVPENPTESDLINLASYCSDC